MKCSTCGLEIGDAAHLCCAEYIEGDECDYCGALIPGSKHFCKDEDMTYICNTCGRTAIKPDFLCNPKKRS